MKQHIVRIALGMAVVLLFLGHAARLYQVGFIIQLDNIIYDARLRLTMPGTVDERIVILDIDEKSLAVPELGRWPWGRDRISGLIEKLFDKYGVAVLGFDVVFAEPDESSGLRVLDQLARKELKEVTQFRAALEGLRPRLDHDGMFARAVQGRPVVLGYYFSSDEGARESAYTLLRDGFERLEEDFAEEQFFAAVRASYWSAGENSPARALSATLIQELEF